MLLHGVNGLHIVHVLYPVAMVRDQDFDSVQMVKVELIKMLKVVKETQSKSFHVMKANAYLVQPWLLIQLKEIYEKLSLAVHRWVQLNSLLPRVIDK